MPNFKIPHRKLFLLKKLTIWPRAIIYFAVWLFFSIIHAFSTTIDTNWNIRLLGFVIWLFPNSKIIGIGFFLLMKAIIYFAYFLLLEYLFNKLSRINISSKDFLQIIRDKKITLNKEIYKIREIILINKLGKKRGTKMLGKLLVCEDDFANDFEVSLSVNIKTKILDELKKKNQVKEVSWWKTGIITPLILSLVIVLALGSFL